MIDDNFIKKEFRNSRGMTNRYRLLRATEEELNYLNHRYNDSQSINETLIRIYNGYEIHPLCPICGKPLELNRTKWRKYCSQSCKSKDFANKLYKESGVRSTLQLSEIKIKIKETLNNHYGVDNPQKSKIIQEKTKQTNLKKYGVTTYSQTDNFKKYMNINKDIIVNKINNTKKTNKTFNTSILETESYKLLKEKYPNIKYQYKSNIYPFVCDFYIPELDLYIECNYHWTHGNKPYEGTEEDNIIVEKWKAKNTLYYNNAINTWTVRDVNKRNIASKNNLNFLEFWNINELKLFIKQMKDKI